MHDSCPIRVDWSGGQGPPALFMHANGFVSRVYTPFLEQLSLRLSVQAMATRAQNGYPVPRKRFGWHHLGKDVSNWLLQSQQAPVIGIGHSMGATALIYAAHKNPQAFRALVLIEPASTLPHLARLVRLLPYRLLQRMHPMRGAVQKRDHWPDQAAFLESCARSGLYKKFDEAGMQALCQHAVQADDTGLSLVYPKAWEAYNYSQVCDPVPELKRLDIPVIGIRAGDSFFMDNRHWSRFTAAPCMRWQTQLAQLGHLAPLEDPAACVSALWEGLRNIGELPADSP